MGSPTLSYFLFLLVSFSIIYIPNHVSAARNLLSGYGSFPPEPVTFAPEPAAATFAPEPVSFTMVPAFAPVESPQSTAPEFSSPQSSSPYAPATMPDFTTTPAASPFPNQPLTEIPLPPSLSPAFSSLAPDTAPAVSPFPDQPVIETPSSSSPAADSFPYITSTPANSPFPTPIVPYFPFTYQPSYAPQEAPDAPPPCAPWDRYCQQHSH